MNFVTAMKELIAGKKVKRGTVVLGYEEGTVYLEATGDPLAITAELLDATDFEAVIVPVVLDEDQLYAVFNVQKQRWVSTTEPAKHKAAGLEVAVFSHTTAI